MTAVRRRRAQARPGELVEAALRCFVAHGFAATRLDEVARCAGVSKGTMYLYFDSKEALFAAVVRQAIVPAVEALEQKVAGLTGGADERLAGLMRLHWAHACDGQWAGLPKLIIAEIGNFPQLGRLYHDEVVARFRRLYAGVIAEGIANRDFRAGDPEALARLAAAPLIMAALWRHSFQSCDCQLDPGSFIDLHIATFLRGIAAGGRP
jgi:AcrR family transcriptional regulator